MLFTSLTSLLSALLLLLAPSFPVDLTINNATLTVDEQAIRVTKGERPILALDAIQFNYINAESWDLVTASEDEIVLRLTYPAKVDHDRQVSDDTPRTVMLSITTVAGGFRLHAAPTWANQATLDLHYLGDHFFGLSALLQPDNRLSPDLTGAVIDVEIDSQGASLKENYASAYSAFYMSSYGYGSFFDTFARGRYDFAINGRNRIHHDTGTLDWYLFVGDDGAAIHESYFAVIGAPKKVPAWGLGPVGWRDQNNGGSAEILADVQQMNDLQIPFTAWFVDRPYSDGAHAWSQMNFNRQFANPARFINQLRDDGLTFMTWTSAATFGDARFERHFPGAFSYIDLSHPPSVLAFQTALQTQQYAFGVKGHKVDRADELFPVQESWHDTTIARNERRNRYAYLSARVHDEALREHWGDDQMTFARAAIHRAQPYLSAIWGGDPRSTWEGMQSNFANAIRSSFMGFPVWGTDVGGYLGKGRIPEDLYIRWMQAGSMSGFFEIKLDGAGGSGRDRMPWRYGTDLQEAFRSICKDRMHLLPYLYSLAATSASNGPLMQPVAYRHLDDSSTYDLWDQFYLGDAILVAPVFTPDMRREVYLPEGTWRDFDDPAERYEGHQTITIEAPLDKLPRFVRENSLYVTGDVYRGNTRLWQDGAHHLFIHATPGTDETSTTFTYIDLLASDTPAPITLTRAEDQINLHIPALSTGATAKIVLDEAPESVTMNGEVIEAIFDADAHVLSVEIPKHQAADVTVTLD